MLSNAEPTLARPRPVADRSLRPDQPIQIVAHLSRLVSHLSRIACTKSLDDLLKLVVSEAPPLTSSLACAVYLRPALVPQYDGQLQDADGTARSSDEVPGAFIVLAAATSPRLEALIGKAYYAEGRGLPGQVLRHGAPITLHDAADAVKLQGSDPDFSQACWYGESQPSHEEDPTQPVLAVPLTGRGGVMGVVLFSGSADGQSFGRAAEDVAAIIAQITSGMLEKTMLILEQDLSIRRLVELGTKHHSQDMFKAITEQAGRMLHTRLCRLYMSDDGGRCVRLVAENGHWVLPPEAHAVERGQDLIGWVFRTGKSLWLDDARQFAAGGHLSDDDLERLSDGAPIDDDDRTLTARDVVATRPAPYLAVPVKTAGNILGVLCAGDPAAADPRVARPFEREDLSLLRSFAATIALAAASERERRLSDLLTQLGHHWEAGPIVELIIRQIPDLVSAADCRVFLAENAGSTGLRLVGSSHAATDSSLDDTSYEIGEGPTGFCALARSALIVNHFGVGAAAQAALDTEVARIERQGADDLVQLLLDEQKRPVGLVCLRHGQQLPKRIRRAFDQTCRSLIVQPGAGLPLPRTKAMSAAPIWSFVAAPIRTEVGELHGVITLGRLVDKSPFSPEAVALVESVAGRLASVLHNAKTQERQKQLLITLAHEINTPLQGILADTENLQYELPPDSEAQELTRHNLQQVQQLHLLTETIMAVLADQSPARLFSLHSIFRPLRDACDMFESEAIAKGCEILEPQSIDSRFPEIEMSLFDLTLAFKNLIHNAVKYSFRPPQGHEGRRFIRVLGSWADDTHYSVAIQNYGVGMTPEEIASGSIFAPHYRGAKASDRRRTGAGLGLSHARQIIEGLHHGTIRVTSKPLQGEAHLTTFIVTLPVTQPH